MANGSLLSEAAAAVPERKSHGDTPARKYLILEVETNPEHGAINAALESAASDLGVNPKQLGIRAIGLLLEQEGYLERVDNKFQRVSASG